MPKRRSGQPGREASGPSAPAGRPVRPVDSIRPDRPPDPSRLPPRAAPAAPPAEHSAPPGRKAPSARRKSPAHSAPPSSRMRVVSQSAPTHHQPDPRRGAQHQRRRAAQREMQRRRRKRARLLLLLLVMAIITGLVLGVNVLFKVQQFRVENVDGTTPADTGIYTEEQILQALTIEQGSNMFGFSPKTKSAQLLQLLPYLDQAVVRRSLPDTVVVRIEPAVERYCVQTPAGWTILSTGFRALKIGQSRDTGLIYLRMENVASVQVGEQLALAAQSEEASDADSAASQSEAAETTEEELLGTALDDLHSLAAALESEELLDRVTEIDLRDDTEISFDFEDRVTVELGTVNNLAYKLQMAGYILRNENGDTLSESDRGTLDVSHLLDDGSIQAVFAPEE